jgi:hypothetical protein
MRSYFFLHASNGEFLIIAGIAVFFFLAATGKIFPKMRLVSFMARKNVSVPTKVKFNTKDGEKVSFRAHKTVKKKVPVSFWAK